MSDNFERLTTVDKVAKIEWEFEVFGRPAADHSRWMLEYVKEHESELLDLQCAREAMEDTRHAIEHGSRDHRPGRWA